MENGIAPALVLNKSDIAFAEPGEDIFESTDGVTDWRKDFLGESLIKWLHEREELKVDIENERIVITGVDERR